MIYVVNKRFHEPTKRDVYIGRPSPLGNPYSHKDDTLAKFKVATVDEAILQYDAWLRHQVCKGIDKVLRQLDEIAALASTGDVYLVCWCVTKTNKKCHGYPVKSYVEGMLK